VKRWIIVLLVGLAVLLLVAPGVVGRLAETRIDAGLGAVDLANENVEIEANTFERGWFSSVGQHRIELVGGSPQMFAWRYLGADPSGDGPALIVDTRLDHGLVPVSSLEREGGSLIPGLVSTVSSIALDRGDGEVLDLPARIYGRVGLGGTATYRLVIDAGSMTFLDDTFEPTAERRTEWSGGEIDYVIAVGGKAMEIRGNLGATSHATLATEAEESIRGVEFRLRRSFEAHALGESELSLEVDSFAVRGPGTPGSRVEPLYFRFENRIDDARTSGSSEWGFAVEGVPGLPPGGKEFAAKLRFDGLDADALARARDAWRAMNDADGSGTSIASRADAELILMRSLEKLAASGGSLTIDDATLFLPQGDAQIESLSVELPETAYNAAFNWPAVLLGSSGSVSATLSEALVLDLIDQKPDLRGLVGGGFLIKNGDRYEIHAELERGRLSINGAPMPLSNLLTL